jgi:hypothetical protein
MKIIPKYMGSIPEDIKKYLIELAGYIDGDFFEPGPITFTFERDEYGDDDLYDNADIYQTAYNYIQKMGNKLNIEIYKIPHTFYTEGDDIVMDFILPGAPLDEIKITPTAKYDVLGDKFKKDFPEVIKRGYLLHTDPEFFPMLIATSKANGYNFDSIDDFVIFVNNNADNKQEIQKVIDGFEQVLKYLGIKTKKS